MPIIKDFTLPPSPSQLDIPQDSSPSNQTSAIIAFISGNDPVTQQPWCPDVRDALPHLDAAFAAPDAPAVAVISVGEKLVWKDPMNVYRTQWGINNIPALVRYQHVDGEVKETKRLIEGEILDKAKVQAFLA
ncbi:hypothetical protein N7539_009126 [Penicillium diatomitis]|uniref:Thioredoxin domain-containing protein n=1 Tax=Penicillium diatomitis TaxID=2819901 RepID=A0A9X0BJN2_9EURO|nr:uncharacterized protein N7539_009126 [Penicillium diatomitis]KAJ5469508.1 hypothetical protein N7539_009126 [Penicillium diatomitis]